ncbi:hypothetical protein BLOT_006362 [Blomia tropicalis]|nr:hypothetical protein BLOT_006362 [Blomia tropicalis]
MIPQENVISLFLSLISVAFNSEWETGKQAGVWFCVGLFQNIQHNSWSRKSPLNAINIGGCGLAFNNKNLTKNVKQLSKNFCYSFKYIVNLNVKSVQF